MLPASFRMFNERGRYPLTPGEMVIAAVEEEWYKVKQGLVGHTAHRIIMPLHIQEVVLEVAMKRGAWIFINDVVIKRYPFGPHTLDIVILTALGRKDFLFVESVINEAIHYKFAENVLLEVLKAFCQVDDWLPKAYMVLFLLPADRSLKASIHHFHNQLRDSNTTRDIWWKERVLQAMRTRFDISECLQEPLREKGSAGSKDWL